MLPTVRPTATLIRVLACAVGCVVSGWVTQGPTGSVAAAQADEWTFERAGYRFGVFDQRGHGLQSQAGLDPRGGREDAWIFQAFLDFRVRQDRNAVHQVVIPVDIVSAASTDALDAVSTASRETEAASIDYLLTVQDTEHTSYQLRLRPHVEEHWNAYSIGGAAIHSFADDNAILRVGTEFTWDSFDKISPSGADGGRFVNRFALGVHAGISQLLSPTTVVSAMYSFTAQFGYLNTTFNAVRINDNQRAAELFPRQRGRHSLSGEIRQAIPETQTYLALAYRFYADSFEAYAQTARATVTQLFGDLWLRGHYRFHYQDAPYFWVERVPDNAERWTPITSDSDLATLHAHELGANLRWFFDRQAALTALSSFVQIGYLYYWRSNGLTTHLATVELGLDFR